MIPGRKQGDFEAGNVRNLGIPGTHTIVLKEQAEKGFVLLELTGKQNIGDKPCFLRSVSLPRFI